MAAASLGEPSKKRQRYLALAMACRDKGVCGRRYCPEICKCARRSLSAATLVCAAEEVHGNQQLPKAKPWESYRKNRTGSWLVRFIKAIIQPFCGVVCNILPNHIIILLPADNVVIIAPLPYRKSGPLRHMCLHLADDLRNSRLSRRFVKPQQQMNMIRHDDGLINRCVRVEFRDVPDGLCGIPAIARERQPVQGALATRKGHAASVRRQSRQRLRRERRYSQIWRHIRSAMPFPFRQCLPEIATAPSGPRNDKSGNLCIRRCRPITCQPARRSQPARGTPNP